MFLVHADTTNRSYAMDYTLFGVFNSYDYAEAFIKKYNDKVSLFKKENADLINTATMRAEDNPEFRRYTYKMYGLNCRCWDFDKLEKADKDIQKKIENLDKEQTKAAKEIEAKAKEAGIAMSDDDQSISKPFTFDEDRIKDYITEFENEQPKSLAGYEE